MKASGVVIQITAQTLVALEFSGHLNDHPKGLQSSERHPASWALRCSPLNDCPPLVTF